MSMADSGLQVIVGHFSPKDSFDMSQTKKHEWWRNIQLISFLSGRPRQQNAWQGHLGKQLRTTSIYVYCYVSTQIVVVMREAKEEISWCSTGGWWLEQTTTKTKQKCRRSVCFTYLKKDRDFLGINDLFNSLTELRLIASLDLNWTDVLLCYWCFVVRLYCIFFIM